MKKLLFLLLVIPFLISASPLQQKHLAVIAALNSETVVHDCSGDLYFGWSAESETVTSGTPPGCAEDTSATAESGVTLSSAEKFDGTYSVIIDGDGYERYTFSLTSQPSAFTVTLYLKVTTWDDSTKIIRGYSGLATDYWELNMTTGDDLKFLQEGQDTYLSVETTDLGLESGDGWVFVQLSLDPSQSNADLFIGVDLNLDGTWDKSQTLRDITTFTATSFDAYTLEIGNNTGNADVVMYIDKIQIKSGYSTANPL